MCARARPIEYLCVCYSIDLAKSFHGRTALQLKYGTVIIGVVLAFCCCCCLFCFVLFLFCCLFVCFLCVYVVVGFLLVCSFLWVFCVCGVFFMFPFLLQCTLTRVTVSPTITGKPVLYSSKNPLYRNIDRLETFTYTSRTLPTVYTLPQIAGTKSIN